MLVLKARYYSEVLGEDNILDIPSNIMKKDNPAVLIKAIGLVTQGKILDKEAIPPGVKKEISRNKKNAKKKKKEKFGIKIPNSTRENLLLDKAIKDNK
eukprot:4203837-Ditylum_brightwellii.AAC.1